MSWIQHCVSTAVLVSYLSSGQSGLSRFKFYGYCNSSAYTKPLYMDIQIILILQDLLWPHRFDIALIGIHSYPTSDNTKDSASLWKVSRSKESASLWKKHKKTNARYNDDSYTPISCVPRYAIPLRKHGQFCLLGKKFSVFLSKHSSFLHLVTVCLMGLSCSMMLWFREDAASSSSICSNRKNKNLQILITKYYIHYYKISMFLHTHILVCPFVQYNTVTNQYLMTKHHVLHFRWS